MRWKLVAAVIVTVLDALLTAAARAQDLNPARLADVVNRARDEALALRNESGVWDLPSYLGVHYVSTYTLLARWLGHDMRAFDQRRFEPLARAQLADSDAPLDALILDYWSLKSLGVSTEDTSLATARRTILARGGIEASSTFTKIYLALFDQYSWRDLPPVPYLLFARQGLVTEKDFAQWVGPHLLPLAYLRDLAVAKDLGPAFAIPELFADRTPPTTGNALSARATGTAPQYLRDHVDLMLSRQRPRGTWGGYASATFLTLVALDDFAARWPQDTPESAENARKLALTRIEQLAFASGASSYLGVIDDGHYWDTALMAQAIDRAGAPASVVRPALDHLVDAVTTTGGLPFGLDFELEPDIDDTAELLIGLVPHLSAEPRYAATADRAVAWIRSMQNQDGGFGAFAKDNTGNAVTRFAARRFADSADLFDESSPDVTGHVLEAIGRLHAASGTDALSDPLVQAAVAYLRASRDATLGLWSGRWGVNYVYGTAAAVVGLRSVGIGAADSLIVPALAQLAARQNPDGGFGEGPPSYLDPAQAVRGPSTPSQTAWGLLALLEDPAHYRAAIDRAAAYLVDSYLADGSWTDRRWVGTGHPVIVYMQYPSYAKSWPLLALARYREL